jgi:DNA polymerase epsilon subunit 2
LIGHDEEDFLIFGMLTQLEEGKIHLEDEDATIELVLNNAVSFYLVRNTGREVAKIL